VIRSGLVCQNDGPVFTQKIKTRFETCESCTYPRLINEGAIRAALDHLGGPGLARKTEHDVPPTTAVLCSGPRPQATEAAGKRIMSIRSKTGSVSTICGKGLSMRGLRKPCVPKRTGGKGTPGPRTIVSAECNRREGIRHSTTRYPQAHSPVRIGMLTTARRFPILKRKRTHFRSFERSRLDLAISPSSG